MTHFKSTFFIYIYKNKKYLVYLCSQRGLANLEKTIKKAAFNRSGIYGKTMKKKVGFFVVSSEPTKTKKAALPIKMFSRT